MMKTNLIRQTDAALAKGVSKQAVGNAVKNGMIDLDPVTRLVIDNKKYKEWVKRKVNQYQ